MLHLTNYFMSKIINNLVTWYVNMSHVTCMGHVMMCRDGFLACEHLATVMFIFRFTSRVHVHVHGSCS